ncbi:MAG: hypothetical protein HZB59_07765 [Ignavibacteriales bacterium]|nr:hypothetical protein [Ignavibacteriales bacterium]
MKQLLIAAFIGGVILFVWGWLSWSVIPIHNSSMKSIENEDAVISTMHVNMTQEGVYVFPGMPATQDQAAMDEWTQKYRQGPIGMVIYNPEGSEPMMISQMIVGIIISIISSYLAAWFLSRSTAASSNYFARVAYCGMLGIFVSLVSHIVNWNWMGYPMDYTVSWIMDAVIGWMLAGFGIGAIIKTPKTSEA